MKFAVVEYSSKSGQVWKHTDSHPNYLANPATELDPTSFGCYVSALSGEHIPLRGLIIGPVEKVSPPQVIYRKIIKRLTGSWPSSYSLKYLQQFDTLLVVHQLSDAHEITNAIKRLKQLSPGIKIIGVPTQPFGILEDAFEKSETAKNQFIDFMDSCDVFITIVNDTIEWYQNMTKTKVVYVPQPYPVEFASQFSKPLKEKEKSILVAGVTQRDDIKKGQLVARALQEKHRDYTIVIPKVSDLDYDFTNLKGTKYTVLPFEEWREHLKTIAKTTLVINTDYTFTRGRIQTDTAAVGTISIGANSDAQKDLYPELMGSETDTVEKLVKQGEKLLTDQYFYNQAAAYASQKIADYNYAKSAERLSNLS